MRKIAMILSIIFFCLFAKGQANNYTQNDLIDMLKESINDIVELNHDDVLWNGGMVRIGDNKSIRIDSIFLMVDGIPKEVMLDNIPQVTPFYLFSLYRSEFPKGRDSVMVPGIILDTECYLKGNYCQIIIFETTLNAYIESYSPHTEYNIIYNNRVIKFHPFLYEFNCETHSWEKSNECPVVVWMDYDINNEINNALYESIMDFMCRLKSIPGFEYTSFIVSDYAAVTNLSIFWYRLTEDLRIKKGIYSEQKPLKYLKRDLEEDDENVVIPKVTLCGDKLTISISYNLMNGESDSIQTKIVGIYEYTLDCVTKTWNLTKTMYDEK